MPRLAPRRTIAAAYAGATLACAMAALAYLGAGGAADVGGTAQQLVRASESVHAVRARTRDAEAAQRVFLITGDTRDLTQYEVLADTARAALARLRAVTSSGPDAARLTPRVDSLGYYVGLMLAELDGTVKLRRDAGLAPVVAVLRSERTAQPAAQVERLATSLDLATRHSVRLIGLAGGADARRMLEIALAGSVLALLLAIAVHRLVLTSAREQRRIRAELETRTEELQLQAAELRTANAELEAATQELVTRTLDAERSETQLAGVLRSATDAIISFDDEHRIVYANAAAERLVGDRGASLLGEPIERFVPERSIDELNERLADARRAAHVERRAAGAPPSRWDTTIARAAGDELPVELSISYARTGRQGLFTALARDVSRQRQLEEEFRQAQKMEAVGRLAGGIAHDFNNLLTVIGATSDFLLLDVKNDSSELARDITEIKRATDRAASLTRQLLAFSRRQLVQPQLLDVNVIVADMEKMLRRLIGEDITLTTAYHPDVGLVRVDRGQLEQIVLNLVVNARDAMPHGGSVHVETRAVGPGEGDGCGAVALVVRDTGVGMDEPTRERIFEPFFTTKEQGKGTGLGLSTVYGIVKASGGDISVESAPGEGTEFALVFPCVAEEEPSPAPTVPVLDTLRGYETVLVVEDEDALRRLTRRVLESRGYTVLEAPNGNEAIRVMASSARRIDLLLSDVVMPGMSGRELVERILPVYPWLRVLFMSGYTEDMMLQHRIMELGIAVLEKPFTPDDLARAVRATLDRVEAPYTFAR